MPKCLFMSRSQQVKNSLEKKVLDCIVYWRSYQASVLASIASVFEKEGILAVTFGGRVT